MDHVDDSREALAHLIRLTGYSAEDAQVLAAAAPRTKIWIDGMVDEFYDTLFAYPPTSEVFLAGERAARQANLRAWLEAVLSGAAGDEFWAQQWIVGLVHIKRRVLSTYMLSMTSALQRHFLTRCLRELPAAEGERLFAAFHRTTTIVAGLAVEGYHRGYIEAVADVTGMKFKLIDRMAGVAVDRLLARARGDA